MYLYTVRKGDSLTSIAKAHKTTVATLRKLNPQIKHPNVIIPGQHVKLPAGKTPVMKPVKPKPPSKPEHHAVALAIEKALRTHYWPHGMCDNFCANMYSQAHSGYGTAAAHWAATPTRYRHASYSAPKGAIVLYGGGSTGAGHATLSLGGNKERSIDMDVNGNYHPGQVHTVTRGQVLSWGTLHYLGWIDPFFQGKLIVRVS